MTLQELFRQVNDVRIKLNLPLITEERFLEEICVMQVMGKIQVENGVVKSL